MTITPEPCDQERLEELLRSRLAKPCLVSCHGKQPTPGELAWLVCEAMRAKDLELDKKTLELAAKIALEDRDRLKVELDEMRRETIRLSELCLALQGESE